MAAPLREFVEGPMLALARFLRECCPSCDGTNVRRSHRWSLTDWALTPLSIRPYRCMDCHSRFYAWPSLRGLAPPVARQPGVRRQPARHPPLLRPDLRRKLLARGAACTALVLAASCFLYLISRQPH